jgi:hypothetical protein
MAYQYRITVGDSVGPVTSNYPGAQWSRIAQVQEERDYPARFERRLVTDLSYLEWFEGGVLPVGYMKLADRVVCPWEVMASFHPVTSTPASS